MYNEQDYLLDQFRYSERISMFLKITKLSSFPSAYELSTNQMYAYYYAHNVLRGPFPAGELAIAQDPRTAHWYARGVLKRPWPRGEPVIARDSYYAYWYALTVLRGPFPQGEPVIARDPYWALEYARYVLGRPWPAAEPAIALDAECQTAYLLTFPERKGNL